MIPGTTCGIPNIKIIARARPLGGQNGDELELYVENIKPMFANRTYIDEMVKVRAILCFQERENWDCVVNMSQSIIRILNLGQSIQENFRMTLGKNFSVIK